MSDKKVQRIMARDKPVPIISQQRARIAELTEALSNLVSELGAPDCGEISEAAEAACNHAIDVLAKEPVNG